MTVAAQKALAAVHRMGGRCGRGRIVDHLLGRTKDAHPSETALSTFGVGAELSMGAWRDLLDQLLFDGLLVEDPNDGRPLVGLGPADAVRAVYRGERRVSVRAGVPARERKARGPKGALGEAIQIKLDDRPLFEALRAWRKAEAQAQAVPPYVIFHDRTLAELAAARPGDLDAVARVAGVGQAKLDRYGEGVLNVVRATGD